MTDFTEYAFKRDLETATESCGDVSNKEMFLHGFTVCWVLRTYGEISSKYVSKFFEIGSKQLKLNNMP